MVTKKLPDKPSELLLLALHDLERAEMSPRYMIDMDQWHSPNGACSVCLAGSVMAATLGVSERLEMHPDDFDNDTCQKLCAVDSLRKGFIGDALVEMGLDDVAAPELMREEWFVSDYDWDRDGFYEDMLSIVGILQAEGL